MKTGNLSEQERARLTTLAADRGIGTRIIDGFDYELNCSLPHLHAGPGDLKQARALLSVVVTALVPGHAYFYLPFLMGFEPELYRPPGPAADPRSLNRQPMPRVLATEVTASAYGRTLARLLSRLAELVSGGEAAARCGDMVEGRAGLLRIERGDLGLVLWANFSTRGSCPLTAELGEPLLSRSLEANALGPLGFGVWTMKVPATGA